MISTSVAVKRLSSNFKSLNSLANLALSITAVPSLLEPNAQKSLKTLSSETVEQAIVFHFHTMYNTLYYSLRLVPKLFTNGLGLSLADSETVPPKTKWAKLPCKQA